MNQGKLEVVKQEMEEWTLTFSESANQYTGMGEFNSYDHYIYYYGQESLRKNGVTLIVIKSLKCNLKKSVHFQGKPFNIMVIQVYALTSYAEEAEVEQSYENLQDLLELTSKKKNKSFSL